MAIFENIVRKLVSHLYFIAVKISPSGPMGFVFDEQATVKCRLDMCNYILQVAIYNSKGSTDEPKRFTLCFHDTNTSNYTCKFHVDMSHHNLRLKCGVATLTGGTLYSSNFLKLLVQS